MPAQEEKLDGQQLLIEYATIFWRRKLWFFLPFLSAIAIAVGLVFYIPKSYKSTTLILVEEQKIPEEIVRSSVSEPIAGRLSTLRQQILSRSFLQEIIDRFGLFKDFEGPVEEKIEAMQKSIDIKTMGGDRMNAFSISFIGSSPVVTMNVTNELASLLIKENFKIREQMVEGTREFIDGELESLKRILEQQEAGISRFKQAFSGELPAQVDASLRTLDRLQITLQQTKMAIKDAEGFDPLAQEWAEQKQKMANLQRRYKENHPDILVMKKEIRELEERILARNSTSSSANKRIDIGSESLLSPSLQRGLSNSLELEELKSRAVRIEAQIRDFERRIENVPKREQDLAVLLRDYDNTQKNYQDLLDKKLTAKISENLEKRQKGERFRILDPANFPEKPYKPDPIKILAFGSFLGILAGIGLVILCETTDASIRKPEELEKLFPFPVLASILNYENFSEKLPKKRT